MKILIICQKLAEDDDLLGAFVPWVKSIAKHADRVDVLCLSEGEHHLPDNCRVYSLGKELGAGRAGRWFKFVKLMFKLMPKCDAVFSHMSPIFSLASWPFVKLYGKRAALWYAHGAVSWKLRWAEKCVDIIFTSTHEGCRIKSDKIHIVGQGIDVNKFEILNSKFETNSNVQNSKFQMVSIGRIAPSKDYETMIKAAEELVKRGVADFGIKVIGKANLKEHQDYFDKIKQMVSQAGLDNYVKFIGAVPNKDAVKYYQEADLYLNMSHTGSLDRAIAEAMACGCVVLTCNEAARGPLSNTGLENLMYEKKNYAQLAEKILEIRKLKIEKLRDIGQRLRDEVVENHSVSALGEKLVGIMRNVLKD